MEKMWWPFIKPQNKRLNEQKMEKVRHWLNVWHGFRAAAIEDQDPVIFFEDKTLYNFTGDVPERYYTLALGKADVKREGSDVTIFAVGKQITLLIDTIITKRNTTGMQGFLNYVFVS